MKEEIKKEIDLIMRNAKPNWDLAESSQAETRLKVKKILKKYNYPSQEIDNATETIFKQIKNKFKQNTI